MSRTFALALVAAAALAAAAPAQEVTEYDAQLAYMKAAAARRAATAAVGPAGAARIQATDEKNAVTTYISGHPDLDTALVFQCLNWLSAQYQPSLDAGDDAVSLARADVEDGGLAVKAGDEALAVGEYAEAKAQYEEAEAAFTSAGARLADAKECFEAAYAAALRCALWLGIGA